MFYSTPNWRCFSHFSSRKSEQDANENKKVGVIYTQNSVFVGVTFFVGVICTSCYKQKQLSITHFCQFLGVICTEHHKFNKILIEIEEYLKPYFVAIVQESNGPTVQQSNSPTVQQSNSPSVQVSNLACKTNLI